MDRMFYLEWGFWMVTAIILSGVRQEHAVWIWRLFTVLVGVDLVVSCFLGREWWNFGNGQGTTDAGILDGSGTL